MTNSGLAQLSLDLVYSAMAVYILALVGYAIEVAGRLRVRETGQIAAERVLVGVGATGGSTELSTSPRPSLPSDAPAGPRSARVAMTLTILAFGLHLAATITRSWSAGRVPWGNMYEFCLAGSLVVTGVFLVLARRTLGAYLGIVLVPLVLLALGSATTFLYTDSTELVPALKSYWLIIHVSTMALSFGVFTVGAAVSLLYLFRDGRAESRLRWLPPSERLDSLSYGIHAFIFPVYTFAVLAGAVWAENAWGRYWGWDPKETWAFIVWVVYAAYLHARATVGWRGKRAAGIALLGYACFVFNLFGVNLLITGLHSYAR